MENSATSLSPILRSCARRTLIAAGAVFGAFGAGYVVTSRWSAISDLWLTFTIVTWRTLGFYGAIALFFAMLVPMAFCVCVIWKMSSEQIDAHPRCSAMLSAGGAGSLLACLFIGDLLVDRVDPKALTGYPFFLYFVVITLFAMGVAVISVAIAAWLLDLLRSKL